MLTEIRIRVLRLIIVALVFFISGIIIGFLFFGKVANAHPGGIAGDGCHNEKATGTRHAHVKMLDGPRTSVDCEVWKVITKGHSASVDDLRVRLQTAKDKTAHAWAQADVVKSEYQGLMSAIHKDRKAAQTVLLSAENKAGRMLQEANAILAQAKAREHGSGPPANRSCQQSLRLHVIDRVTSWLSDSVKVDEYERKALERACLGS